MKNDGDAIALRRMHAHDLVRGARKGRIRIRIRNRAANDAGGVLCHTTRVVRQKAALAHHGSVSAESGVSLASR